MVLSRITLSRNKCKKHMVLGLHHVAIRANNFDETIRFYTELLGFKVQKTWTLPAFNLRQAAMLQSADGHTAIEVYDELDVVNGPNGGALLHFALRVDDAQAVFEKAVNFGAKVCVEPMKLRLGHPVFEVNNALVYGPNGEIVEFLQSDDI